MKLAFRSDGGAKIGMGHIMRCLSLAKASLEFGHEVVFLTKYSEGYEAIIQSGFQTLLLEEDKAWSLSSELDQISKILNKLTIEVLVVDTYSVNEAYLNQLKEQVNLLVYIDDINSFEYPVDVILNGNITGEYMGYEIYFKGKQLLLGPKYNLIRDEFKNLKKRELSEDVRKIMITTGGSDPFNTTKRIIEIIRGESCLDNIELNIIVGNSFKNIESLEEQSEKHKNIVLYKNVSRISEIMLNCDIAISSCGSTLYELCACGTPTLGFILADNQELIAKSMSEEGYIRLWGWHNEIVDRQMVDSLKAIVSDYETRRIMSEKQQQLVDGRGAERVVKEIESVLAEERS